MNILLIDVGGNFLDLALKCKNAGHAVKWFLAPDKSGKRLPIGDGLGIERIYDWKKWMRWGEVIITSDNTRYIAMLEPYRKYGYPIFGCNMAGAEMELDRSVGQKVFKDHGVQIMDYKTFHDYDSAEAFVKKTMKRYVSKPSADVDKALSYVSKSPADMIAMLRRWKKIGRAKAPFILQEFRPGIELAVGGWIGPKGFSGALNINIENKKFLNGDLGCNTGEQGTTIIPIKTDKLAKEVLFPCTEHLMKIGYVGYVDVAVIIDKDGAWPLEWTMRYGYPHSQIISTLNKGDPVTWIADLMHGYDSLELTQQVVSGVVVTMGDFPYNNIPREQLCGVPIYCDTSDENLHPCEIMAGTAPTMAGNKVVDLPCWTSAGNYLFVATGVAPTISGSLKRAYETIEKVEVPNSIGYRTDITAKFKKQLPELQKMGYATGLTY
ncbi:hypothetical protein [Glaciimonas immobilis]|uniref:Phosphoribosylamine--glycine ligase n=1 Tax=Glaciimonas immobilis TaxID=728004 RepID=A0A840RWF8_9BURK|nr:hypothetical protein [Glaciimonas immobilis]KAF3997555.1 hypothetical protein HAV38_12820 [Glaciimonas immobilis]MBB5200759.1 phosphoribosylamine--glycine ligase [Glaciimonas immobilis]